MREFFSEKKRQACCLLADWQFHTKTGTVKKLLSTVSDSVMQLVIPVVVHSHLAIIFVLNSYNSSPHYERGNIAVKHRFSKMFPRSLRAQKTFAGEAKCWLRKHFSSFDYRIQFFCWHKCFLRRFRRGTSTEKLCPRQRCHLRGNTELYISSNRLLDIEKRNSKGNRPWSRRSPKTDWKCPQATQCWSVEL